MEGFSSYNNNGARNSLSVIFHRRRRLIFLATAGIFIFFLYHIITSANRRSIDEVYGFLHVVLNGRDDGLIASELELKPNVPNDLSLYASGYSMREWAKEAEGIDRKYPVIVFSKSYCPYSRRAKDLLASYQLQPPPKIIEVDLREDDVEIKQFLTRLTGHSTFPNILVKGKTLGGSDNLAHLHSEQALKEFFVKAGVKANNSFGS